MIINHNLASLYTLNALNNNQTQIQDSLAKLSSGQRIVTSADDPSGLAISQGMQAEVNGLTTAQQNANDGLSALQVVDGGLSQQEQILQRMNTLAVRAANDLTISSTDASLMQSELTQLNSEYVRVASNLDFNGKKLLDGNFSGNLQVGAGKAATSNATTVDSTGNQIFIDLTNASTNTAVSGYFTNNDPVNVQALDLTNGNASAAIGNIQTDITNVSAMRGYVGAIENRLDNTVQTLGVQTQNVTASMSRITDVDMAAEMSNFTREQILQQAGTAMLAQANAQPQSVLSLLK